MKNFLIIGRQYGCSFQEKQIVSEKWFNSQSQNVISSYTIHHQGPCAECSYELLKDQIRIIESYGNNKYIYKEPENRARTLRFKKDKLKRIIKRNPEVDL